MFNGNNLYKRPLIQMRNTQDDNGFPSFLRRCHSSEFWSHMENDRIEKIVAARFYPNLNKIVFKIKFSNDENFYSMLIKNPELRILQRIWECDQVGFNHGIKQYLLHSVDAGNQYIQKNHKGHPESLEWYGRILMGGE